MKLKFQRNYKPDNEYIRLQLAQQNIQWTFNPPLAPHFGGVWERLIQTAKRSLLILLGSRKLTLSVFQTVVAEAEAILNSRPLTHVGCSISNEGPLTPNHFLLRRPHMCLKPLLNSNQRFSTKDFKLTQTLLDHYRNRLLKEYVPELNKRVKLQKSNEELAEGDIVWVLKDFTPRGIWLLGKIVKAHKFRRDSQEFRHPDGYRNGTKTSINPTPCIPKVVKCAGGSLKQVHRNTHSLTHTQKLNVKMKTFLLYCVYIFISNACFCCQECKGTKFLYILSPPTPSFSSPHLHFRPPKPIHFLISIPPTYFH